ncbi:MAG: peptidylprolyl isomerase [Phycisphaerales bacterium]
MTVGRQVRMLLVFGALAVTVPAGLARAAVDPNEFKTEIDKVSYIIGSQFASRMKAQGVDVSVEMLVRGIRDALAGQQSPFSEEEQKTIMSAFQQQLIAKMRAKQEEENMAKLGKENEWKVKLTKPEQQTFDATKDYFWVLETNKGNIKIKLMPDVAPMHVSSTIFLTEKHFYDGTIFHRVIPGFMAQGGCPLGTGTGSPGYKYAGEFSPNVKHDRPFLLSMANAGPNTDGSQFFITFVPTPHLDGKHTIFGEVVEGQDTVKKLEAAGSPQGKPTEELKIVKATIEVKAKG